MAATALADEEAVAGEEEEGCELTERCCCCSLTAAAAAAAAAAAMAGGRVGRGRETIEAGLMRTLRFLLSIALTHSFFQMVSSSRSFAAGYMRNESRRTTAIRRGDSCRFPRVPITFEVMRS